MVVFSQCGHLELKVSAAIWTWLPGLTLDLVIIITMDLSYQHNQLFFNNENLYMMRRRLDFPHSRLCVMPTALTVSSRTPSPAHQTVLWRIRERPVVSGRLRGQHSRTRGRESDWHHRQLLLTCRYTNTNPTCTQSPEFRGYLVVKEQNISCSFQAFDYEQKKLLATKGKNLIKYYVISSAWM